MSAPAPWQRLEGWLDRGGGWAGALLLVLLGVLCWFPSLHGGIVPMDTQWLVVDNPYLKPGNLAALPTILWEFDPGIRWYLGAEYLPVRDLSVLLDLTLFGTDWFWHHVGNLALYLAACVFLWSLLRRALGSTGRAWLLALLFCTMPVHVENTAWLAGRKDVLGLLLSLAAVWVALRARPTVGIVGSALLTLLAIWSKNTSYVTPLWVLSAVWVVERGRWRGRWPLAVVLHALVLGLCFGISLPLGDQVGLLARARFDGPLELLVLQGRLSLDYALLLLDPTRLCLHHEAPVLQPWLQVENLVGVGLLALLLGAFVWAIRRRPLVALGLFWMAAAFAPTSQIIPLQNVVAERYLLLPSVGLVLALGAALPASRGWQLSLLLVALVQGAFTSQRAALWQDARLLVEDVLEKHPGEPKHVALLLSLSIQEQPAQAVELCEEAIARYPELAAVHGQCGVALLDAGEPAAALAAFEHALRIGPADRIVTRGRVVALLRQGDSAAALEAAGQATRTYPRDANMWSVLGAAALEEGEVATARVAVDTALALNPLHVDAICNSGSVAWLEGDADQAGAWWRRCLELKPEDAMAQRGLRALGRGRRPSETER